MPLTSYPFFFFQFSFIRFIYAHGVVSVILLVFDIKLRYCTRRPEFFFFPPFFLFIYPFSVKYTFFFLLLLFLELEPATTTQKKKMVDLDSVVGKVLVGATSSTTAPATDGAREAARLFLRDVTHTLRCHAVVAGVALAFTPVVYQLTRFLAQHCRAHLVSMAKSVEQRSELFDGSEADGVIIDPADEGGVTVSYNTESLAQHRRSSGKKQGDGDSTASPIESLYIRSIRSNVRSSWVLSSFAHRVLAAQRAPNVQFVRVCSRAAVLQYGVAVIQLCTTSCLFSVAALSATHVWCTVLDKAVPLVDASSNGSSVDGTSSEGGVASFVAALRHFVVGPLFSTAAPPSPSVGCSYGLYNFGVSAASAAGRLVPLLGTLQTQLDRFFNWRQPLYREWRGDVGSFGVISPADPFMSSPGTSATTTTTTTVAAANARADAVWAALTPRGFFIVTLLRQLPLRVLGGVKELGWSVVGAVRQWQHHTTSSAADSSSSLPTATPPSASSQQQQQQQRVPTADAASVKKAKLHTRLICIPIVRVATALAGDVAFAGVVFAATLLASSQGSNGGLPVLVHNVAGARYNAYCWVMLVSTILNLAVL